MSFLAKILPILKYLASHGQDISSALQLLVSLLGGGSAGASLAQLRALHDADPARFDAALTQAREVLGVPLDPPAAPAPEPAA